MRVAILSDVHANLEALTAVLEDVDSRSVDRILFLGDAVGHGIGTMNHEPPWLAEDDLTELQPGMTLCIEVGCYDPELIYYGNMPEDIWLVTDKGLDRIGVDLPCDIWLCG